MSFLPPIGTTKESEYIRSAEHFNTICQEQSPYFGLAMLLDSGYQREDLLKILEKLRKYHKG